MDLDSIVRVLSSAMAFILFAVCEFVFAADSSTQASSSGSSPERQKKDETGDMVKGLAIGLGGFFGLVVFLCLLWKCCCNADDSSSGSCCPDRKSNDQKDLRGRRRMADHGAKVSPSPPSSVMSWSRKS